MNNLKTQLCTKCKSATSENQCGKYYDDSFDYEQEFDLDEVY